MTTSLTQSFLSDRHGADNTSPVPTKSKGSDLTSQLVSHLMDAVNSQLQAESDLEKFRIATDADVEKDKNTQYYTLLGSLIGVFGS